ncbi:unnamed protein product [Urochloa humidicola]
MPRWNLSSWSLSRALDWSHLSRERGSVAEAVVHISGAKAAAGALVRGEDARDIVGVEPLASEVGACEVEVERTRAPYGAPAGGEDLRAGAVLGGEKGDDVAEDAVGEVADAVDELFHFIPLAKPSPPPPLGSGGHRRGGLAARRPPAIGESEIGVGAAATGPHQKWRDLFLGVSGCPHRGR